MKVRICIIGNGAFANKAHYPSLCTLEEVEIVGICGFDTTRLRATAARWKLPESVLYPVDAPRGYQRMLQTLRPDGVYVLGPPHVMFDIWVWCLGQGFPIFVEKPMGLTLHQAQVLAGMAEDGGLATQVGHQRRSAPLMRAMKAKVDALGPVTHGSVAFFKSESAPMLQARDRMLDDFTHVIDTALWIGGGEVVGIDSHCKRLGGRDIDWIGAMLHFDNGASCMAVGNWNSGRRSFQAQMHTRGAYAVIDPEKEAWWYAQGDTEGERFTASEIAQSKEWFVYGGCLEKSREFVQTLLTGTDQTSSPFQETLRTMEVCTAILAQHHIQERG